MHARTSADTKWPAVPALYAVVRPRVEGHLVPHRARRREDRDRQATARDPERGDPADDGRVRADQVAGVGDGGRAASGFTMTGKIDFERRFCGCERRLTTNGGTATRWCFRISFDSPLSWQSMSARCPHPV